MYISNTYKPFLHPNRIIAFTTTCQTLKFHPLLNLHLYSPTPTPSSLSLRFKFTTTSDPHSFTVSYLVNSCGFSPESALTVSQKFRLNNPQKPDSVLAFFRNRGFSNSQIHGIIKRQLPLLLSDPDKVLLPKFEFLASKGVSRADIVRMVSIGPRFLSRSLENHIVPSYEFVRGFLQSDDQLIACMNRNSSFLSDGRFALNSELLIDNGVKRSDIAKLLRRWPSILCSANLLKTITELKGMGFVPSTSSFCVALLAKRTVNKAKWDEKVETFKKWGWSQEHVLEAFKRQPYCMLSSADKINAVMSYFVSQLGCDSLELVRSPVVFQLSLQKRLIPRASVVDYLNSKGLRKKDASMTTPFALPEKLFLKRFVKRFKEHSSHLLKMYEKNMNRENTCL
ncbi:uncharacterized protein LOC113847357 [Abrus precatorius]|uniref:Uncharacterized protein LOC113847357 n=1 Tax=Abrus precatorius TaxID=3816 RepID=A0A8B8JLS4_ABRPR|nr:uncharacterized protein LOC113847357 [Abrus precatorius]